MRKMKVFLTGGGGFLGRSLLPLLQKEGHQVAAPTSRECDLTNPRALDNYRQPYDLIIHLAAWTQAGDFCLKHPGEQWLINQAINTQVLSWWHQYQPQAKAVLVGTSCAYDPELPLVESNYLKGEPIESLYTYAMTKRMLWVGALSLSRQYGLCALNLVPSTLCGSYYHKDGRQMHFIYDLARKILEAKKTGQPAVLWGNGHQRREVVLVDDFCRGILRFLSEDKGWGEIFNLGSGQDHTIREYADTICKWAGVSASLVQYDESRYTGAFAKCLSVEKAKRTIQWNPSGMEACVRAVLWALA